MSDIRIHVYCVHKKSNYQVKPIIQSNDNYQGVVGGDQTISPGVFISKLAPRLIFWSTNSNKTFIFEFDNYSNVITRECLTKSENIENWYSGIRVM